MRTFRQNTSNDPHDVSQPRGKQDWHEDCHAIWYRRTTSIWQTVWLEAVAGVSIRALRWTPIDHATMALEVTLPGVAAAGSVVSVSPDWEERDEPLGTSEVILPVAGRVVVLVVKVSCQRNGQCDVSGLRWCFCVGTSVTFVVSGLR